MIWLLLLSFQRQIYTFSRNNCIFAGSEWYIIVIKIIIGMNIESLLVAKVIEAVKECYGAEAEPDKIQLQATRKEFAGDLTVVVFPFTRFSKNRLRKPVKNWENI